MLSSLIVAASPALAVVGGQADTGPLARASVMVLTARGGLCSAVVVASDAILTAGHCVAGPGSARIHVPGSGDAPILLGPAAIALHPGYAADAVRARRVSVDMALVRVAEPLPSGLAAAALSGQVPARGSPVTLGGYGLAREGDGASTGTFRTAALTTVEPHGRGRVLLWVSDPRGRGAGACQGDSGGPIADEAGSVAALAGWAAGSAGRGCGEMSQGVLVAPQRGWIDRVLAGWGRAAQWR